MKFTVLLISLLLIPGGIFYSSASPVESPSFSGLRTTRAPDAEILIREVFLKSDCSNVSNVQRIGDERGVGFFENGASSIGFSEGIILATGLVSNAQGPNVSSERTSGFGDDSFDADLKGLSTGDIFDNVGIEFDFVPQKEFISFNYVFASEEYCEFVGSIFNDVFGFFVSGPGINGPFDRNAVNVALLPETEEYVAINNVNHQKNSDYYVKNELRDDTERCGITYQPAFENEIEYDGFTVRLKATLQLIPCETYHIRLVVGDVGDDQLDSAVFLESKSFDIGPEVEVKFVPENGPTEGNVLTEGCNEGELVFSRTDDEKLHEDLPVDYFFSSNSMATMGVDFLSLPDPLVIPANQQEIRISLSAIEDDQEEGPETLVVEIQTQCNCVKAENTVVILDDPQAIIASADSLDLCPGEPAEISINVTSGKGPYRYQWENGTREATFAIDSVVSARDYQVTITDFCEDSLTTRVSTRLRPQPRLELSGAYDWCQGNQIDIPIFLEGSAPWQLEYQIQDKRVFLDSITEEQFTIPVDQPGTLQVINLADAHCTGLSEGQVTILEDGPRADPSITPLTCPDLNNARIDLNISGDRPYQVRWDRPVNDPESPSGLAAGLYSFTITDPNNCTFNDSIRILAPGIQESIENGCSSFSAKENLYIPTAFSPNNDGRNDELFLLSRPDFRAEILSWRIFDRWGNQLFHATNFLPQDRSIRWDGTYRNRKSPIGVYIYQLEILTSAGEVQILSGNITLMR